MRRQELPAGIFYPNPTPHITMTSIKNVTTYVPVVDMLSRHPIEPTFWFEDVKIE